MNNILKLYDLDFINKYFKNKVLPHYPEYNKIKSITIRSHKRQIWEHTYHVVIEFKTTLVSKKGKKVKLPIFCSAHSSEPRKNVYTSLKYLWDNGFGKGNLSVPRPLFYSNQFRATFYRGVPGKNLYHFIKKNNREEIESIIPKAAFWFAKLHHEKRQGFKNFNKENSRIKSVTPGVNHLLEKINKEYPEHYDFFAKAYECFIKKEEAFLKNKNNYCLVHGDAHPENIIKMSKNKIALIDFTDLCLSDFARDLGSFTQQIDYMTMRKINDTNYSKKINSLFLDSYFSKAKIKLNQELEERIALYYQWTATRTATFFLIKHDPQPERAFPIIKNINNYLKKSC